MLVLEDGAPLPKVYTLSFVPLRVGSYILRLLLYGLNAFGSHPALMESAMSSADIAIPRGTDTGGRLQKLILARMAAGSSFIILWVLGSLRRSFASEID